MIAYIKVKFNIFSKTKNFVEVIATKSRVLFVFYYKKRPVFHQSFVVKVFLKISICHGA